ncbi:MAG: hypothetical protein ACUVTM_01155 [Candidatus Bathyarchaeia archaeon]
MSPLERECARIRVKHYYGRVVEEEGMVLLKSRGARVTIAILLIYLSSAISFAEGTSVEVHVMGQYLQVQINSNIFQNMTAMPETKLHVTGVDLEQAKLAFKKSLLKSCPAGEISNISVRIASNNVWLNVTAQFVLGGIIKVDRDVTKVDMSWMSFKIEDDLQCDNMSYNLVGQRYLQSFLQSISNKSETRYYSPIYTPIDARLADNIAGNITSFDLTGIETEISSWRLEFDANSKTTVWRTMIGKNDLRVEVKSGNTSRNFYCYTESNARVTITGYGVAIGSTILVETTRDTQAIVMLGVIGVLTAFTVAFYNFEVKLRRRLRL